MIFHRPTGASSGHTTTQGEAPIYARLVEERGDVPTDVRNTAERAWREVEQTMDFRYSRPPAR